MYKISRQEDYAVLLVISLIKQGDKPLSLNLFAQENGISFGLLKQIANKLKKRGLITSKEGAKGGYTLAVNPSRISLYDVVTALNIDFKFNRCEDDECESCNLSLAECPIKPTWAEINNILITKLKKTKFSHLV